MQDFTDIFKDLTPIGDAGFTDEQINLMCQMECDRLKTLKTKSNHEHAYDMSKFIKDAKRERKLYDSPIHKLFQPNSYQLST